MKLTDMVNGSRKTLLKGALAGALTVGALAGCDRVVHNYETGSNVIHSINVYPDGTPMEQTQAVSQSSEDEGYGIVSGPLGYFLSGGKTTEKGTKSTSSEGSQVAKTHSHDHSGLMIGGRSTQPQQQATLEGDILTPYGGVAGFNDYLTKAEVSHTKFTQDMAYLSLEQRTIASQHQAKVLVNLFGSMASVAQAGARYAHDREVAEMREKNAEARGRSIVVNDRLERMLRDLERTIRRDGAVIGRENALKEHANELEIHYQNIARNPDSARAFYEGNKDAVVRSLIEADNLGNLDLLTVGDTLKTYKLIAAADVMHALDANRASNIGRTMRGGSLVRGNTGSQYAAPGSTRVMW